MGKSAQKKSSTDIKVDGKKGVSKEKKRDPQSAIFLSVQINNNLGFQKSDGF